MGLTDVVPGAGTFGSLDFLSGGGLLKETKRLGRRIDRTTRRSLRASEKAAFDWLKPPEYPDAPEIPPATKDTGEDAEIARVRAEIERRRRNRRSLIVRNPGVASTATYSGLRI